MRQHHIQLGSLNTISKHIQNYSPHPNQVNIVAVTKKFNHTAIISALSNHITCIGENQVQEFLTKKPHLLTYQFESHLIGHLQSNKINHAIDLFDVIETVDSTALAHKLNKKAQQKEQTQKIYIQINIGSDAQKHGFDTKLLFSKVEKITKLKHLSLIGVMTILPFLEQPQDTQKLYSQTRKIYTKIQQDITPTCVCLSMGMTRDYIYALQEGATHIRLGTKLYGPRD